MAEDETYRLEALSGTAAALARAVPHASAELVVASAGALVDPRRPAGATFVLRDSRVRLQLYLARKRTRLHLIFSRPAWPNRVVFNTRLSFQVTPTLAEPAGALRADEVGYRLVLPRFVIARPTPHQLDTLAPPGATRRNTVLMAIGPEGRDVLAVKDPDPKRCKAEWRYTLRGVPSPGAELHGHWPLGPFLALTEAIRSWVSSGCEGGDERPMGAPHSDERSEPRRLLYQIVKAYCAAATAVGRTSNKGPRLRGFLEPLAVAYGLGSYEADVVLRLMPDGSLARDEADDLFQLLLRVRVGQEAGRAKAHVAIGPPDFLVSGEMHRAFLDALARDRAVAELRRKLARLDKRLAPSDGAVRRFLADFGPSASVFRTTRAPGTDTDMVLIPGAVGGRRVLVVFHARFVVDVEDEEQPVTLDGGSVRALYAGAPDPDALAFDREVVRYFLRLIVAVRNWIGVLP